MDAAQFCGEYHYETKGGKISFSKRVVDKFIAIYTHLKPEDFTEEMRNRLKMAVMIDLATKGFEGFQTKEDFPVEKIELPEFIFK